MRQVVIPMMGDGGAVARLLAIPAGMAMPEHSHCGFELTLVLQGAFCDESGFYRAGDIQVGDETLEHTPIAEKDGVCVCLIATQNPLRFSGLIPQLLQRFIGI